MNCNMEWEEDCCGGGTMVAMALDSRVRLRMGWRICVDKGSPGREW